MLEQESGDRDLKGTENLIALLAAILPDVETVLSLAPGTITRNIEELFKQVIDAQKKQIARQIQDISVKFEDALNTFIAMNPTAFDGISPEISMQKIYGAVQDSGDARHVFLRPHGLNTLCNDYGFDRSGLLSRLKDADIFRPYLKTKTKETGEKMLDKDGAPILEEVDYKQMKIRGSTGWAYHFVISNTETEWQTQIAQPEKPAQEKIF